MPTSSLKKSLKSKLKGNIPKKQKPLWDGPESNTAQGGISQSLLGSYLACGERFRVRTIEGLERSDSRWNHRLGYGNLWHTCEEGLAKNEDWLEPLQAYCRKLVEEHPLDLEAINHWYQVCKAQFPLYVKHWSKHPDVKQRTPLLQEQTFCVPYLLPSGRTVYIRGKWDSVDLIGRGKQSGIWLQENKTKGDIEEMLLQRQLMFDLQTGVYLVALDETLRHDRAEPKNAVILAAANTLAPLAGVRYNVIRRPLSGGKGSIRKHKAKGSTPEETDEHFYGRVVEVIEEDPAHFFMRWSVEVSRTVLERFKTEFLDPVLENLCDDYQWWVNCHERNVSQYAWMSRAINFKHHTLRHFRFPYGTYNAVMEGQSTELDDYIDAGVRSGLRRATSLFKELA